MVVEPEILIWLQQPLPLYYIYIYVYISIFIFTYPINFPQFFDQWDDLMEHLQELPIFHGRNHAFPVKISPGPMDIGCRHGRQGHGTHWAHGHGLNGHSARHLKSWEDVGGIAVFFCRFFLRSELSSHDF
jgi:hypothetical protein